MSAPTSTDLVFLTRCLTSLCPFSDEQLDLVVSKIEFRDFQTEWRFSEEGGASEYFGLILKGIFKLERNAANGRHYIVDFCSEGTAISNYTAWVLKEPADLTIEALEPGRIALLRIPHYEALFQQVPVWNEFIRKVLEREIVRLANRERHLLSFDAEQRYRVFVETRQHQLGRLLNKDIAAYLGITPVSLSRLTAKLQRQKKTDRDKQRPPLHAKRGPHSISPRP